MCSRSVQRGSLSRLALTGDRRFPKSRRLLTRRDFDCVYREGMRRSNAYFSTIFRETKSDRSGRVGLAVGRAVGGAVVRNRVKRLLREAVRNCLDTLPDGWEIVLQARRGITDLSASALDAEVQRVFCPAATETSSAKPR